jgi:hypothetical protein
VLVFLLGWIRQRSRFLELDRRIQGDFLFLGLCGLLYMNAGFGGWWGGASPGPRYLSVIFPAIGYWITTNANVWSPRFVKALALGLIPPGLFFIYFIAWRTPTYFEESILFNKILEPAGVPGRALIAFALVSILVMSQVKLWPFSLRRTK